MVSSSVYIYLRGGIRVEGGRLAVGVEELVNWIIGEAGGVESVDHLDDFLLLGASL